jgi:hypothetical protein
VVTKQLGRTETGSSSLCSHWEKVEKYLISPWMCFKPLGSGHKRHPWRSDPDDAIRGVVTLGFRREKSVFF